MRSFQLSEAHARGRLEVFFGRCPATTAGIQTTRDDVFAGALRGRRIRFWDEVDVELRISMLLCGLGFSHGAAVTEITPSVSLRPGLG